MVSRYLNWTFSQQNEVGYLCHRLTGHTATCHVPSAMTSGAYEENFVHLRNNFQVVFSFLIKTICLKIVFVFL